MTARRRTQTTRVEVSSDRGVFMISVAAELADMHPQTLRMYESRGLIEPKRSPKGTRLYSHADVQRLRQIQEMTAELGMNLAGVLRVFELEQELDRTRARAEQMERRAEAVQAELEAEIERVRRSYRAELVPYEAAGSAVVRARDARRHRIEVRFPRSAGGQPPASS